jgi:hypothetical protein
LDKKDIDNYDPKSFPDDSPPPLACPNSKGSTIRRALIRPE